YPGPATLFKARVQREAEGADGSNGLVTRQSQVSGSTEVSSEAIVMSAEDAGKRKRGGGDGAAVADTDPAKTGATSSADLESMLQQALSRIDSLERQHEEMKASINSEIKASREDARRLKEENKALQASDRANISTVEFHDNGFANMQDAISELGKSLKKSRQLKSLEWSRNPIHNTEDMSLFIRVLSQGNTVDKLKFTLNSNENAQAVLSGVEFSTYKVLDFRYNNLQTNGRTDIPDLIAENTSLRSLYLSSNELNDDDAVLIAQSLGRNTHLTNLEVKNNDIQERGMRALYEAVNDTSSLNALSDCNPLVPYRGATSRIGRNDHTNLGFSSLHQERQTRPLRSEAARGGAGSSA
ncbi:hypothetical protein THAOC_08244, partial [Thalassiosira oceanica]